MAGDIKSRVLDFYSRLARDPNHRYRSWEHCFDFFRQHKAFSTSEQIDRASLHLSFYLASWGMYRGSSFLLWKDYTIHRYAVSLLSEPEYEVLWDLDLDHVDGAAIGQILSLSHALREVYRRHITEVDGKPKMITPSDTLITKILLGTVGCTAACDRFFIHGYRHSGLPFSRFDKTFLSTLVEFYKRNSGDFKQVQDAIAQQGSIRYPMMKLLDMYFWNIGFSLLHASKDDEPETEA